MRDQNINIPTFPFLPTQITEIWEPGDMMLDEWKTHMFIQKMQRKINSILEIDFSTNQRTWRRLPSELQEEFSNEDHTEILHEENKESIKKIIKRGRNSKIDLNDKQRVLLYYQEHPLSNFTQIAKTFGIS